MKWLMLAIVLVQGAPEPYVFGPRWDSLDECKFVYYSQFTDILQILAEEYGPDAGLLEISCVTTDILDSFEVKELEA